MTDKNKVEVVIGGRVITLSGYEDEAHYQKIALYINKKIKELEKNCSLKRMTPDMQNAFVQINIVDELMKANEQIDNLERDLKIKEKQLSELKAELVELKVKYERYEGKKR